jgi:hypothetical protein
VTPDIARALRMSAVVAQRASADMARRLESLCDHDLAFIDRAEVTGQLYVDLADLHLAVAEIEAAAIGPEQRAMEASVSDGQPVLLPVAHSRWRRHGWRRGP